MSRHAVVTGASTGIGEATALHLDSLGYSVFAGVRKDEDADRLSAAGSDRLRPLKIDVTEADSTASAAAEVREAVGDGALAALVNNAGVAVSAPLEFVPIEQLRELLEVNVIGQVAATQAFLPLLRAGHGRIVNVSSIGGRIALPLAGPYAASKFALEAISDSLRRELRHLGVDVVVVEPGGVKTPIWKKATAVAEDTLARMPAENERLYGNLIRAVRQQTVRIATETGIDPAEVARVIGRALTTAKPRTRYLVGRDAKLRNAVAKRVPDRTFDALVARALTTD
jgi:NAD(P)-dependent dehydrogenase (short-subunit alcohol dehydrogenase family)